MRAFSFSLYWHNLPQCCIILHDPYRDKSCMRECECTVVYQRRGVVIVASPKSANSTAIYHLRRGSFREACFIIIRLIDRVDDGRGGPAAWPSRCPRFPIATHSALISCHRRPFMCLSMAAFVAIDENTPCPVPGKQCRRPIEEGPA